MNDVIGIECFFNVSSNLGQSIDQIIGVSKLIQPLPFGLSFADLFQIIPLDQRLLVQCRSLLEGDAATSVCSVACNACGRCAVDAAAGLIAMRDGLPVIDYARIELATRSAIERCPTGAIVWLEGGQFPNEQVARFAEVSS